MTQAADHFRNLAGIPAEQADETVLAELRAAGIKPLIGWMKAEGEVQARTLGILTRNDTWPETPPEIWPEDGLPYEPIVQHASFGFRRAWYYWIATGYVPLTVAEELHADPLTREHARAAGHAGAPHPSEVLLPQKIAGHDVVGGYHIDTPAALRRFVEVLRERGLV